MRSLNLALTVFLHSLRALGRSRSDLVLENLAGPAALIEPTKPASEKMVGHRAVERPTRASPLGVRPDAPPKPRGMAGNLPSARAPGADSPESRTTWRRGWDSNPRYPCEYT